MEVSGRKPGRSFKDTVGKSSAEDGEVFCQPCSSDGDWMVAMGYCENCNEYLCATCLKVHRRQAVSRNHKVLEGENMPKARMSSVTLNACSELCAKHTNEIVKFYCSAHDVVGCGDCMVLDHKSCKVDRIQDISMSYFNGAEHQEQQHKVDQFLHNIEQVKREIQTNDKNIQQTYIKAVNDVKSFKKEILEYLDKAEADMLAELNKRKKSDEKLISDLKEHEKTLRSKIQELHEKLQLQLNQANELFVPAKEMKERITYIGDSIKDLQQNCQFRQYEFVCSKNVKEMVASQFKLGELLVKKKNIAEMEPNFDSEIEIKVSDDTEDCFINACAVILYNRIILADSSNKCLKIVDIKNTKIAKKYKLKSVPCGLAVITKDRFAVSLPREEKIQFLTLTQSDKITESNAIKVKGRYDRIACQENKIMMLYTDHVVILNMDGKEKQTISVSNVGIVRDFALDSKSLYVSDSSYRGTSVFRFDYEGNLIATYNDTDLIHVRGLCVTRDGTVLVCDWKDDGSIHMISPECKKIKDILNHNDHVICPWCVSFCDETNRLFLCNYSFSLDPKLKNVMKIFQLK
ncbi:uncharacterized protein LOC123554658 [Mercenaria mercenaria]|uniref:uncharacterized protein LOC123554658 n=1 Tax=Mercenaria mercenaria TaxID=6596 RepID=UPI00234F1AE2|nr:uncharacterized protein LOC123554658 [Mercenaria mercenaria]XP_053403914.1 uncharacterized protein LOC123554658 [Mercenaria mercenaria]